MSTPTKRYIRQGKLGKGLNIVYKVQDSTTGELFAMKNLEYGDDEDQEKEVRRELTTLQRLEHPNVIRLVDYMWGNGELNIIFPIWGAALDYEKTYAHPEKIAQQILKGLDYVHSLDIIHGDLKTKNVLYDPQTDIVKIIDFGASVSAVDLPREMEETCFDFVSLWFRAPEILMEFENPKFLGKGIDIWAFGVIYYSLLYPGKLPFEPTDSSTDHRENIFRRLGLPGTKLITEGKCSIPQKMPKWKADVRDDDILFTDPMFSRIFVLDPRERSNTRELLEILNL